MRGVSDAARLPDFPFAVKIFAIAVLTLAQLFVDFVESFTNSLGLFFSLTVNLYQGIIIVINHIYFFLM